MITSITEKSGATLSKVSYNSNGLINEVVPESGETPQRGDGKWKYNKKYQVTAIGFDRMYEGNIMGHEKFKYYSGGQIKASTASDWGVYLKYTYDKHGYLTSSKSFDEESNVPFAIWKWKRKYNGNRLIKMTTYSKGDGDKKWTKGREL